MKLAIVFFAAFFAVAFGSPAARKEQAALQHGNLPQTPRFRHAESSSLFAPGVIERVKIRAKRKLCKRVVGNILDNGADNSKINRFACWASSSTVASIVNTQIDTAVDAAHAKVDAVKQSLTWENNWAAPVNNLVDGAAAVANEKLEEAKNEAQVDKAQVKEACKEILNQIKNAADAVNGVADKQAKLNKWVSDATYGYVELQKIITQLPTKEDMMDLACCKAGMCGTKCCQGDGGQGTCADYKCPKK